MKFRESIDEVFLYVLQYFGVREGIFSSIFCIYIFFSLLGGKMLILEIEPISFI